MNSFFHDASKVAFSLLKITLNTISCTKEKVKDTIKSCVVKSGFVKEEDFAVFTDAIKDLKVRQDEIEKKVSEILKSKDESS